MVFSVSGTTQWRGFPMQVGERIPYILSCIKIRVTCRVFRKELCLSSTPVKFN